MQSYLSDADSAHRRLEYTFTMASSLSAFGGLFAFIADNKTTIGCSEAWEGDGAHPVAGDGSEIGGKHRIRVILEIGIHRLCIGFRFLGGMHVVYSIMMAIKVEDAGV